MKKKIRYMRWIVWGLAVAFYFYEYLPRVSVSVMVDELMDAFSVQAGALGLLSSLYLFAYAPMQLPVGMMMDRFGARKLLTFATLGVGLATLCFSLAPYLWIAGASRLVIGSASAFAFIGMIYICSHWFEDSKLAIMIGLGNSLGMLGAVCGEGPLSAFIEMFSWRPTMFVIGLIGVGLAILIFLVVRNEPPEMAKHCTQSKADICSLTALKTVLKNKWSWLNGVIALCFYAPIGAFAALWAVPFIERSYNLSTTTAGLASSMFFVGIVVAGPIIGHVSDKLKHRKPMILTTTMLTLISLLCLIYISLPIWGLFVLFFISGAFCGGHILCYCLGIELNDPIAKGTAIAFTNFMVFIGSAVLQPIVGAILDYVWSGNMLDDVPIYSTMDYRIALICFPIALFVAFILALFIKEGKDIDIPMYKELLGRKCAD